MCFSRDASGWHVVCRPVSLVPRVGKFCDRVAFGRKQRVSTYGKHTVCAKTVATACKTARYRTHPLVASRQIFSCTIGPQIANPYGRTANGAFMPERRIDLANNVRAVVFAQFLFFAKHVPHYCCRHAKFLKRDAVRLIGFPLVFAFYFAAFTSA